jgi:hypothetical protein
MQDITTSYSDLLAKTQQLLNQFPYSDPLRASITLYPSGGTSGPGLCLCGWLKLSADQIADLEEMGIVSPALFVMTSHVSSEAAALADLARLLDVPNPFAPVVYATSQQKEAIIRLLNDPRISRHEKTLGLLNINRFTAASAEECIVGLKKDINARAGQPVFEEVPYEMAAYAVTGEAFQVSAA